MTSLTTADRDCCNVINIIIERILYNNNNIILSYTPMVRKKKIVLNKIGGICKLITFIGNTIKIYKLYIVLYSGIPTYVYIMW